MDFRSDTEKHLYDWVADILEYLTMPKASKQSYQELVHRLRMMKTKLENREFGCESGRHSGPCDCGKVKA